MAQDREQCRKWLDNERQGEREEECLTYINTEDV